MNKQLKKEEALIGNYKGQITITGCILALLIFSQVLTFALMMISRIVLLLIFIALCVILIRYDDMLKKTTPVESAVAKSSTRRNRIMAIQASATVVIILLLIFVPGVPIWCCALGFSLAFVLLLRMRLTYLIYR